MNTSRKHSPLIFFALVFALSIPFWLAGALSASQLLPDLPVSALGFLCPLLAAAILVYRENGRAGVAALLKRSFDFERIHAKVWIVPLLLLEPAIKALSYAAIAVSGTPIPPPQVSIPLALALAAVFFIAGLGEELGWMGYADPLQARFGALGASLILGVVWSIWHFIPLLQAHRSPEFIAWWTLETIASRLIIVWLYNNTGRSVFVAAIFHAMVNLTWQLFPVNGSYYDPRITGVIAALIAVILVVVYGPRTLTRQEFELIEQPK